MSSIDGPEPQGVARDLLVLAGWWHAVGEIECRDVAADLAAGLIGDLTPAQAKVAHLSADVGRMKKTQPGRAVTEAEIVDFAAKTQTPIRKVRGPECANCRTFIPFDEVTLGAPQRIPGGTHAVVPAYDITPPLTCPNCKHVADYPVSALKERLI